MRNFLLTSALVVAAWLPAHAGAEEKSPTARQIANFKLQDFRGAAIELDHWKDRDLVVVAFLGTECPLAKLYGPRLVDLAGQYESKNVGFVAIDSNEQDTLAEMAHFARTSKIGFPFLKDPANTVADLFDAVRTPEVFDLDRLERAGYAGRNGALCAHLKDRVSVLERPGEHGGRLVRRGSHSGSFRPRQTASHSLPGADRRPIRHRLQPRRTQAEGPGCRSRRVACRKGSYRARHPGDRVPHRQIAAWNAARRNHVRQRHRPNRAEPLRGMPSTGRDRSVHAHVVCRCRELERHDPRSCRRTAHAAVARQCQGGGVSE